jgi:hypothetical protein
MHLCAAARPEPVLASLCVLRPSDSKKKKAAMKKAGSKASLKGVASAGQLSEAENSAVNGGLDVNGMAAALAEFELNDRSTTGVLTSHPQSRDIHFESFSLLFHGHELLTDTRLELNYGRWALQPFRAAQQMCTASWGTCSKNVSVCGSGGATPSGPPSLSGSNWAGSWGGTRGVGEAPAQPSPAQPSSCAGRLLPCCAALDVAPSPALRRRYGLIGPNGCGKSCLLKALGARDLPIPEHIDVYLLDREIPGTDMTALEESAAAASRLRPPLLPQCRLRALLPG